MFKVVLAFYRAIGRPVEGLDHSYSLVAKAIRCGNDLLARYMLEEADIPSHPPAKISHQYLEQKPKDLPIFAAFKRQHIGFIELIIRKLPQTAGSTPDQKTYNPWLCIFRDIFHAKKFSKEALSLVLKGFFAKNLTEDAREEIVTLLFCKDYACLQTHLLSALLENGWKFSYAEVVEHIVSSGNLSALKAVLGNKKPLRNPHHSSYEDRSNRGVRNIFYSAVSLKDERVRDRILDLLFDQTTLCFNAYAVIASKDNKPVLERFKKDLGRFRKVARDSVNLTAKKLLGIKAENRQVPDKNKSAGIPDTKDQARQGFLNALDKRSRAGFNSLKKESKE